MEVIDSVKTLGASQLMVGTVGKMKRKEKWENKYEIKKQ